MFDFNLKTNELEALDSIVADYVVQESNLLPSWTYMGQDIWTMDFGGDAPEAASTWVIESADVA